MFDFFRKRRIKKYTEKALVYVQQKYILSPRLPEIKPDKAFETPPTQASSLSPRPSEIEEKGRYSDCDSRMQYCIGSDEDDEPPFGDCAADARDGEREEKHTPSPSVQYCLKEKPAEDHHNASAVSRVLRNYSTAGNYNEMLKTLEQNVNETFVDRMLYYINIKGVRDPEVYKAAQVDKRLFSKIVSNHEYKPSKDTVIALALALELSQDEANDLLSRAGYTFSHSNKRDIIIEFFFREKVYNLMDVNDVLYSLNQKLIGRL